jgi:tol-pal system protein YbgF
MKRFLMVLLVLLPTLVLAQAAPSGPMPVATQAAVLPQVVNPTFASAMPSAQAQAQAPQPISLQQQVNQLRQSMADFQGLLEIQGNQLQRLQMQVKLMQQDTGSVGASTNASAPNKNTSMPDTSSSADGQSMYQTAYQAIANKQYSQAEQSMNAYLAKYPNGKNAAKAHYWLGELYAIAGDQKQAVSQLNTVVSNYPDSSKAPDAMLKLGMIAYGSNQYAQAKAWFSQINAKYANSSAARVASQQLLQLQKAGY